MTRRLSHCLSSLLLVGAPYALVGCSNPLSSNPTSSSAFLQPAPAGFSFTSAVAGNAQVSLSWQASEFAASYTLMRGTASGNYTVTLVSGQNWTSFTDTGLTNGVTYYYMVTAVGPGGATGATQEAQATPILPPMLLIADTGNNRIVAANDMTGSGWTTLSGLGSDQLSAPQGVFMDSNGTLYVADTGNSRIVGMQDIEGDGWLPFGSAGSGLDQLQNPLSVSVDNSGNIYFADTGNGRIVQTTDLYGSNWVELSGTSVSDVFTAPASIAFPLYGGYLVADRGSGGITGSLWSMSDMLGDGWSAWSVPTSPSPAPPAFQKPTSVFVADDGTVYVADSGSSTIYHFDGQGNLLSSLSGDVGGDTFDHPTGICVDPSGIIYVADYGNSRIVSMIDMNADNWTVLNTDPTGVDSLYKPYSVYCRYGMP